MSCSLVQDFCFFVLEIGGYSIFLMLDKYFTFKTFTGRSKYWNPKRSKGMGRRTTEWSNKGEGRGGEGKKINIVLRLENFSMASFL